FARLLAGLVFGLFLAGLGLGSALRFLRRGFGRRLRLYGGRGLELFQLELSRLELRLQQQQLELRLARRSRRPRGHLPVTPFMSPMTPSRACARLTPMLLGVPRARQVPTGR